ncbi:hypothetical protein FI667_g16151, partial [Globisporangium splendens]
MAFLRADPAAASSSPPSSSLLYELRSSKNLIGSSVAKCDVVVPQTLDLHALLSVSSDHASYILVPFSASGEGACYLNNRVVPLEGARVVHGDRLAFGTLENGFVLNGQASFSANYLSSRASRSLRDTNEKQQKHDDIDERASLGLVSDKEVDEDDDEDELPAVVEKPTSTSRIAAPSALPTVKPEDAQDDQDAEESTDHLNDSLPGFSEPVRVTQKAKQPRLASIVARSLHDPKSEAAAQPSVASTTKHKRQEITSHAFVRWRRGIRIQHQHRQQRAEQLRNLKQKLARVRRNHIFFKWKAWASMTSQVTSCRMDAFQQRSGYRVVLRVWTQWRIQHLVACQLQHVLCSIFRRRFTKSIRTAFHTWTRRTKDLVDQENWTRAQRQRQHKWDLHMTKVAEKHYTRHHFNLPLTRILHTWHAISKVQRKKLRILRTIALRGSSRVKANEWRKWVELIALTRHTAAIECEQHARAQKLFTEQRNKHQQIHSALQEHHAQELQHLHNQLQEKEDELKRAEFKQQQQAIELQTMQCQLQSRERQKVTDWLGGRQQTNAWNQSVESYFENAVQWVLVETMLEQKVHNANERVEAQEVLLTLLRSLRPHQGEPSTGGLYEDTNNGGGSHLVLSNNAQFLHEMVQQFLSAIAQLAAAHDDGDNDHQQQQAVDPVKLRHSTFLTNSILERQKRHVEDMTIMLKASQVSSKSTTDTASSSARPPAARA